MILTDEEIKATVSGDWGDYPELVWLGKAIAKAQLKKVVEYLIDSASRHGDLQGYLMYTDDGKALLEEVK